MPGVVLSFEVIDNSALKLLRSQLSPMKKEALQEVAKYFHEEMVPRRFAPNNDMLFHHEKRNQVYKDRIKRRFGTGPGKYTNLQLSGRSKRRATLGKITGTANQATLTVETTAYFRRPFVGAFRDEKGREKKVTRQPDKVAEMLRITETEKGMLRDKYAEIMLEKIKNPPAVKAQNRDANGRFIKG